PPPPPPPVNYVANGGFEESGSPWVFSGSAVWLTGAAHSGTGSARLAASSGSLSQEVTLPAEAFGSFSFWLRISSEERGKCPRCASDFLYVDVISETGTFTVATFDNRRREGEYLQRFANL